MANIIKDSKYKQWLCDLKLRIRQNQIKAAVKVNVELLRLYWDLGHDITVRQMDVAWGSGFFEQLSRELSMEYPDMQGFSATNLKYCKRFYLFYTQSAEAVHQLGDDLQIVDNNHNVIRHQVGDELQIADGNYNIIRQQLADELQIVDSNYNIIRQQVADEFDKHPIFQIPWFHQVLIISKCKTVKEALFYVQKTIQNGWSRAALMSNVKAGLFASQGKALNNFSKWLPAPQSDLAGEILKDPYNFSFLTLTNDYKERELENALVDNITKFLLELGQGFAYIGRQVPVMIGKKERFIDLLFYHLELRCYVVVELKTREFESEHAGKLGLYVAAINHQRKKPVDNPTIGLLICATKDDIEVQYSLESSSQPIGVSEYELSKLLPDNYKSTLPSIEDFEEHLKSIQ